MPEAAAPVLQALARLYERTQAGRTGRGEQDLQVDFRQLLQLAGSNDGEEREVAVHHLREAERGGVLKLERHSRDPNLILKVRLPLASERALYKLLGQLTPTERREQLAAQFHQASNLIAGERWKIPWENYCERLSQAAMQGNALGPFSREDLAGNAELLDLIPKLLAWRGESLLRFASSLLCGDSKRLEELAPRVEEILHEISGGAVRHLEDLGILANPRFALMHGPLILGFGTNELDLRHLSGPFRISLVDLQRAEAIRTGALRCVTIENETTFHELAKLRCGDLLAQTTFAGSATLALLQLLPDTMEFYHFGDADPEGYEILRDLRERSGRLITSLRMEFRPEPAGAALTTPERRKLERLLLHPVMEPEWPQMESMLRAGQKGAFEQESLGPPLLRGFPYYPPRG